ncbi:MAG: DMT family transporter [Methylococcaceae bacterium]
MQSSPAIKNQRYLIIGYSLVLIGAFSFSAKAVLIKLAYGYSHQLDAITLMMLRMSISLPFFLLMAFWSARANNEQNQALNKTDWLMILGLGTIGYYLSSWFDFRGLQYVSAGLERIILFLYPTFVVLFSAILYKQKINRHQLLALILSYGGLLLVFINTMQNSDSSKQLYFGSALIACSAVSFAGFLLGSGVMIKRIGSTRFTAYSMTVACLMTCTHFLIEHGINALKLPVQVYYLAIIMAVFATVLPSFMMNAGIKRVGASSAAILSSTGPIGTLILAFFFLGELVTPIQLVGTALVLLGVYVISQKKS